MNIITKTIPVFHILTGKQHILEKIIYMKMVFKKKLNQKF